MCFYVRIEWKCYFGDFEKKLSATMIREAKIKGLNEILVCEFGCYYQLKVIRGLALVTWLKKRGYWV